MSNVVDIDEARCARELRELGPAVYLTLEDVRRRLDHDQVERAIVAALAQPEVPDFHLEPDDEPRERETLAPSAPIGAVPFEVCPVIPWRLSR